jgi:pimeloyl-ACP methyl ester carboxylesterase
MPHVDVNGLHVHFEDSGGAHSPVLLVHGFALDHTAFDAQVAALAGAHRVIRVDIRGFGRSTHGGKPFSLLDVADDCARVLDHLGIARAVIGGLSMGGFIAQRFALRYPERVKALVFIGTHGFADPPEAAAGTRHMIEAWRAAGPIPPLLDGIRTILFGDSPISAPWVERWKTWDREVFTLPAEAMISREDITARLGELTAPSIVLHGTADQSMPLAVGEQFAKALPNTKRFVAVEGGPHVVNMSHPEAVNAALQGFLAEYG